MTDIAEVVERLREMGEHPCRVDLPMGADLRQAADLLTAQQARIEGMEAALKPFAKVCDDEVRDDESDTTKIAVRIGDLRAARLALP